MAVKFLKKYQAYNAGEVAGFTEQKEAQLCREGFARPYVKGESTTAVPEPQRRSSQDDPDFDPHAGGRGMETKQQTPSATGQTKPGSKGAGNGKGKSSR